MTSPDKIPARSDDARPRVSVVMPCYNVEPWLEVAVRSVLAQTERDFEIVLVDDGSRDGTLALATRLAEEDPRIRVVRNAKNGGRMLAMNCGLNEARGRWIAVLDADDWFAPTRLQTLLDKGEAAGVDMVTDDWIAVDNMAGLCLESPLNRRDGDVVLGLDDFLKGCDPVAKGDYGMLKSIVRTDFLQRTGLHYHERATFGEDFYYHLAFFLAGGKCLLVDEALYYYVEPFGSVSLKWAQAGRKRYHFEMLNDMHEIFMSDYGGQLTAEQKRLLIRRDQGNQALVSFHQAREAVQRGNYGRAIATLANATLNPLFWRLLLSRIRGRMIRLVRGSPRRILGPVTPA